MNIGSTSIPARYQIKGSLLKQIRKYVSERANIPAPNDFISILQWYNFNSLIDLKTILASKSGKCFTQITSELAREISATDHKYRMANKMGGTLKVLRKISLVESEKTNFMEIKTIRNEPGHFEFSHDFPEGISLWAIYYLSGAVHGILDLSKVQLTNYLIKSRSDFQKGKDIYTRSHVEVRYRDE